MKKIQSKRTILFIALLSLIFFPDLPQSTSIEFFNGVKSPGKFFVPAKSIGNFSFPGVYFKTELVSHVSVAHEGHLDQAQNDVSNNGLHDLVVMDDFLYSEPVNE